MKTNDAVLIALLVVLVIIVACQCGGLKKFGEGFDGGAPVHQQYLRDGDHNPYMVLNKKIDDIRGYRNDGYNQPPLYSFPRGLDVYHRSGASIRPERIAEAEREQWFAALDADHSGQFNTELAQENFTDTMQYHTSGPAIDYGSYITDLVTDPRTRDNHSRWVEEMKPWSGTAMKVDTLDLEPYVDFIGLRRPQPVAQYNPLQLTEVDTYDLASNNKFNFQG